MEKEFIPYKEAKLLKELKFDEKCLFIYGVMHDKAIKLEYWEDGITNTELDEIDCDEEENSSEVDDECFTAILFQQAFRWLREVHNIHVTITCSSLGDCQYHINKIGDSLNENNEVYLYAYEEALEVGLQEALKLIKI